jgi:hypothetical protein
MNVDVEAQNAVGISNTSSMYNDDKNTYLSSSMNFSESHNLSSFDIHQLIRSVRQYFASFTS